MPKLQNVTMEEIKSLDDRASDVTMDLHEIANRIEKGYCDPLINPMEITRSFLSLSRAAADLAAMCLGKAVLQEQKRELEALLKEKMAKKE